MTRDFVGYGAAPPDPHWPHQAVIAVQCVLNYEEGAENNVLDGDPASETFLTEISPTPAYPDRHRSVESLFEYGSRAGVWRLLDIFASRDLPLTVFAVTQALERNPDVLAALSELGHEVACHGLRWRSYQSVEPQVERAHIAEAVRRHTKLVGTPPVGWYTGRDSPHTRSLVVEHGGFWYDSDSYADDVPYWTPVAGTAHLVVPYALDTNDMRYYAPSGFGSGADFFAYLRDAFDVLYAEGLRGAPKMMSVGLYCRISGRPARAAAVARFLDYVLTHDRVWVARRRDIAAHWRCQHPSVAKFGQ